MSINQFGVVLTGAHGALNAHHVTPNGLKGLFHHVLNLHDPQIATWLHDHPSPKPYTLAIAHYDLQRRQMAGLLISTVSQKASDCIISAWRSAYEKRYILRFGKEGSPTEQPCVVTDIRPHNTTTFERLAASGQIRTAALHFITATAFRQGKGGLLFPLPGNVFMRPFGLWQTFAPTEFRLPADWPEWCERNVFCIRHDIRTAQSNISRDKGFHGFVGKAWYQVMPARNDTRNHNLYSKILNALSQFATYSGVGQKTSMGMGAVELVR